MDRLFRIDFYPQDWLIGTSMLDAEECGVYIQICALIYARKGPIKNDPEDISRKLKNCSIRKTRAIIERLEKKGKIHFHGDFILQKTAERELNSKRTHLELSAKGGRNKAEKERELKENKDLSSSGNENSVSSSTASPTASPTDIKYYSDKSELSESQFSLDHPPEQKDPIQEAVEIYNQAAKNLGLSICQKISNLRKSKLKLRLKDCGGIEGWKIAIEELSKSKFLIGQNDHGWKASFDFILQEESFIKLMEGTYRDKSTTKSKGNANEELAGFLERLGN